MEGDSIEQVLQKLAHADPTESEVIYVDLDENSLSLAHNWKKKCCYGRLISDRSIDLVPISETHLGQHLVEQIRVEDEFAGQWIYQFFFQSNEDLQWILDGTPYNIDNSLLVLVAGTAQTCPPFEAFDWIEVRAHLWRLPSCFITRPVARNIL